MYDKLYTKAQMERELDRRMHEANGLYHTARRIIELEAKLYKLERVIYNAAAEIAESLDGTNENCIDVNKTKIL